MKKLKISALFLAVASMFSGNVSAQEPAFGNSRTNTAHVDWCRNAVIYEVNLRQGSVGRTLESYTLELPRLKELGVDILWLMPIHPISEVNRKGTLGSYYAVADYKAVNPEFGTLADMKKFVKQAHKLGLKVIIDEVCNHTGCDNAWVNTNPEFYVKDENGKMIGPYDWTDTYKLDYSNQELREQMLDALKFWVREVDIDGYRCDVAGEVPTDFWDRVRQELLAIKPVFMLAEATKPELLVDAFDADYNWPMKDLFNAISATKGANAWAKAKNQNLPAKTALDIDVLLAKQAAQYPQDSFSMNMITNHDLNSWEGTEFDRYGNGVFAFAVLSYTLPGVPMMYTGQEVGFNHAFEFFEHDQVPVYAENKFTEFYKKLNTLKHTQKALDAGLQGGKLARNYTENTDVYAFTRRSGNSEVLVIVNLSGEKSDVKFKKGFAPATFGMVDYFSGAPAKMPTELAAWEYRIFVRK